MSLPMLLLMLLMMLLMLHDRCNNLDVDPDYIDL